MEINKGYQPIGRMLNIILAEDDFDDRILFEDAIEDLPVVVQLHNFSNGKELMKWLKRPRANLPDVIFLDLNMPEKNGFASLAEIKRDKKLQDIPVIIFSIILDDRLIKQVYNDAAHYYISKPVRIKELKFMIYITLKKIADQDNPLPGFDNFILTTS